MTQEELNELACKYPSPELLCNLFEQEQRALAREVERVTEEARHDGRDLTADEELLLAKRVW